MPIDIEVSTPESMAALGAHVARQLRAGDIVALDGPLGAGKTTFTRGLGGELGVRGTVSSPTFVLARTHPRTAGGAPLVHVDAYRLGSAAELDDLDIDFAESIVVVEWAAGMLAGLDDSVLRITIERPTGAGRGEPVDNGNDNDSDSDGDTADDEPIEARVVRIEPLGDRWARRPFVAPV
ncbi:tRNA (adenosine(37)-N6)-threonylcarbamoyltransferase complex ATPase subunit type 1 TsaE [Marisediminicola sp. LYQ134]|uniref:tRNA (adenosine(37)-N6)-threonylcarbamoyltransferase complex ATPase subunit type 1 TsaE n=1 Tax=Marisediminicola sp. LYQ134 TaxID=3391061 RepID=UPI003983B9F6